MDITDLTQEFRNAYVEIHEGRDYVRYDGLRHLAHDRIKDTHVSLVETPTAENGGLAVVLAVITDTEDRQWSAFGEASPINCAPEVLPYRIRIAEIRAKGRAMRDMLDLDMVMFEELYPQTQAGGITNEQANRITQILTVHSIPKEEAVNLLRKVAGKDSLRDVNRIEADVYIGALLDYAMASKHKDGGNNAA